MTHAKENASLWGRAGAEQREEVGATDSSSAFEPSQESKSLQCGVVLTALMQGPKSTDQLRELGVRSPAARVYDLRRLGHNISTGRIGSQGQYVLGRGVPSAQMDLFGLGVAA